MERAQGQQAVEFDQMRRVLISLVNVLFVTRQAVERRMFTGYFLSQQQGVHFGALLRRQVTIQVAQFVASL